MIEAKTKTKLRHEAGIQKFQHWLEDNPDAERSEKYAVFNLFVDPKVRRVKKDAA